MTSRESIALELNRYLPIIKRRWIPAVSILGSTLALSLIAANYAKPLYQAEGKLLFKDSSFRTSQDSRSSTNSDRDNTTKSKSSVVTDNSLDNRLEVISALPLLKQTIAKIQLKDEKGNLVSTEDLQSRLELKIVGSSDVIQIKYQSPKPQEAARVVNTLMSVYLEHDLQLNRNEAVANLQAIDRQLPLLQRAVNDAETALRQFKQKHQIVDLTEEGKSAISIIGNLETAINTTRAQIAETTAQSNELRQKLNLNPQEAIAVSTISQSSVIQANIAQLQEIERKLAAERRRFSDNNPIIISLKDKQTNLTNLLQQQITQTVGTATQAPKGLLRIGELKQKLIKDFLQLEVQQIGLTKKLTSLTNAQVDRQRRVQKLPQLTQEQQQLERKIEIARSAQLTLSNKVQELALVKDRTNTNARIIAEAIVPVRSESGHRLLIMSCGLLLGSCLAIGTISLLELRDKSLKTLKQVKDAFGYQLLGIIPAAAKQALPRGYDPAVTTLEVAVRDTPQAVTSEMSRMIQANLRSLVTDRQLKTIAITSSIANEGKSKVAANLAAAIAQVGQRVLLIDADMRVPYQHQFWKLPLKKGLSEVLTEKAKFKVISWKVMNNLDILTAGTKLNNPLACLDSKQMRSLLREVSELYDLVIIDTPPILVAADALAVEKMTDGLLLVARPGVIDDRHAAASIEKLQMSNCHVLGTIVNGIIDKNETENHFACVDRYFNDEAETELPWTDYMTQLGQTIAEQSQLGTGFAKSKIPPQKISD